jgi:hypothetical protein
MLLRKVMYASDHPCAGAPECGLPQQCYHRPAVWHAGVVPGWGPQADVALLPMSGLGGIICLGYLIWFFLWIVLHCILGGRESIGTFPVWTAIVLGATLLGSLIAEMSFMWRALVH